MKSYIICLMLFQMINLSIAQNTTTLDSEKIKSIKQINFKSNYPFSEKNKPKKRSFYGSVSIGKDSIIFIDFHIQKSIAIKDIVSVKLNSLTQNFSELIWSSIGTVSFGFPVGGMIAQETNSNIITEGLVILGCSLLFGFTVDFILQSHRNYLEIITLTDQFNLFSSNQSKKILKELQFIGMVQ